MVIGLDGQLITVSVPLSPVHVVRVPSTLRAPTVALSVITEITLPILLLHHISQDNQLTVALTHFRRLVTWRERQELRTRCFTCFRTLRRFWITGTLSLSVVSQVRTCSAVLVLRVHPMQERSRGAPGLGSRATSLGLRKLASCPHPSEMESALICKNLCIDKTSFSPSFCCSVV